MKYLIYFLYQPDGRIDDYVSFALRHLRKHFSFIHVVSNGPILFGKDKLESVVDLIQVRENAEFDVGAYKDALFYRSDEYWANCKEVTLANFTFFGPIGSFEPMFSWASKQAVDFWGVSAHKEMTPNPISGVGTLPRHIQSHWITVRSKMLKSPEFMQYWRNLPFISSYNDSVLFHESQFTSHFEKLGYTSSCFFDDSQYNSAYPVFHEVAEAVARGLPILKRRLFYHTPVEYYDGHDVNLGAALRHVKEKELFPSDLIWESSRMTPAATLYNTADNMAVVAAAPQLAKIPATFEVDAIFAIRGAITEQSAAKLGEAMTERANCVLVGLKDAIETVHTAFKHSKKQITVRKEVVPDEGLLFEHAQRVIKRVRRKRTDQTPILFGVLKEDRIAANVFGLQQIAKSRRVAFGSIEVLEESKYLGLACPAPKTFGSPSDIERFDKTQRKLVSDSLTALSVKHKPEDVYISNISNICFVRPSLLNMVVDSLNKLANPPTDQAQEQAPGILLQAFLDGGLPVIATQVGFVTKVITNTDEVSRLFVKAESRLRNATDLVVSKNAFEFSHTLRYLEQFSTQSGREKFVKTIHVDAFNLGWKEGTAHALKTAVVVAPVKAEPIRVEKPNLSKKLKKLFRKK